MPRSPGARYLREKPLREAAAKQAWRQCQSLAQEIRTELNTFGTDNRQLKLQTMDVPGGDAEMILNWAFLVPGHNVADVRKGVEKIGARYAEQGVTLEISGPWPPYNFCPSTERPTQ